MTPYLWSGLGLIKPLDAYLSGPMPPAISGVSIDTRTLEPGDLFVALTGDNGDGHQHVATAFAAGAAACLVDESHADALRGQGSLYVVRGTLPALERLGVASRARSHARIVAVTGSVGKTSTKEALREVLGGFGATHASVASYNNHWGVPLTLARMPSDTRYGVFEIGMNHAGEITPLTKMVRPHVAVITTVAPVHLEHFADVDAIADAKAEIFAGLEPGGVAVLHRDIPQWERLHAAALAVGAEPVAFGRSRASDAQLRSVNADGAGSIVEATIFGERLRYRLGAPGVHMALNSLAVLLVARALDLDIAAAADRLATVAPAAGRGNTVVLTGPSGMALTLIDESYNANPVSMRAALALLGARAPQPGGRRIAILGDMLELGSGAPGLHEALAGEVAASGVDLVFAAGPLMKHLFDVLPQRRRGAWAPDSATITPLILDSVTDGDVMMIKGSNGSRMGPIVTALKTRYSPAPQELALSGA